MKETYTKEETVQLLSGALGEFVGRLVRYTEKNWPEDNQKMLTDALNTVLKDLGGEKVDVQGSE